MWTFTVRVSDPFSGAFMLTVMLASFISVHFSAPACCIIQTKIDFNGFSFFLGMYLDFFDRKILGVLTRKDEPLTLAELVRDSGFARSTVIVHLERLGSGELILKEKKPSEGRGRPEFQYRPADAPQPRATPQPSAVVLEFSRLKKACRYEKGGYCKLVRDRDA